MQSHNGASHGGFFSDGPARRGSERPEEGLRGNEQRPVPAPVQFPWQVFLILGVLVANGLIFYAFFVASRR